MIIQSDAFKKTVRAYKAAEASIKADIDGTAPFETDAERKATEKIRDSAREAIIAAGISPEVALTSENIPVTGSIGAARAPIGGWNICSV